MRDTLHRGILLETLHQQIKTMYLSDLRYNSEIRRHIVPVLIAIPDSLYSALEWSYSISYLYGTQLCFKTVIEAKTYCQSHPLLSVHSERR